MPVGDCKGLCGELTRDQRSLPRSGNGYHSIIGGGIYNRNAAHSDTYAALTNVTFHSNTAVSQIGNDIYNGEFLIGAGYIELKNVTIFEPMNNYNGQAIFSSKGLVILENSIVSTYPANTACSSGGQGTIFSLGHNLGDTYCGLVPIRITHFPP